MLQTTTLLMRSQRRSAAPRNMATNIRDRWVQLLLLLASDRPCMITTATGVPAWFVSKQTQRENGSRDSTAQKRQKTVPGVLEVTNRPKCVGLYFGELMSWPRAEDSPTLRAMRPSVPQLVRN